MSELFEKTLLLCPRRYSIYDLLLSIISKISSTTKGFDIDGSLGNKTLWLNTQMFRFPAGIKRRWDSSFLRTANNNLLKEFNEFQPDLVFVYNSEYLMPETCAILRKRAKLVFYLGDSPFYTPHNNYFLTCLTYSDLILSPDSFWISQLNMLGLTKTLHFIPGIDEKRYFIIDDSYIPATVRPTDILYVGGCYLNSWGFKKAMLMSRFSPFDLRIYGNKSWKRWFDFFPELKHAYTETGYISTEHVNLMFNRTRIVPVDGNPAILNGVHLRLMEALGSGTLPLTEYREDVDKYIFSGSGIEIPYIKNYDYAGDLAGYWIKNDKERKETAEMMRSFVLKKFSPESNADRLLEKLKRK